MSLDKTIIDMAVQKHYSDFDKSIKDELRYKLSTHPEIVEYTKNIDSISSLRSKFAEINKEAI